MQPHRVWLVALMVLSFAVTSAHPALIHDGHTTLTLPFDGQLTGIAGESPTQALGTTFEVGVQGQAVVVDSTDLLTYSTTATLNPAAGTIAFWIKPRWNGIDGTNRVLFAVGSQANIANTLVVAKDSADTLTFLLGTSDSEAYHAYSLRGWRANEWHHIAVTWTIPGWMRTYVDGVERTAHTTSHQDLIREMPALLSIGGLAGTAQANAVIDELSISDVARSAVEIARQLVGGLRITSLDLQTRLTEMFSTWETTPTLSATTNLGPWSIPADAANWSSTAPSVATVASSGRITARAAGSVTITATVNGVQASTSLTVNVPKRPPERGLLPAFLASPAAESLYEVRVVIIRYLPTKDGATVDVSFDPDFSTLNPISLSTVKQRIDAMDINVKFMLEEGSRFRGYQSQAARPSLGYRVVDAFTFYEPTPQGKQVSTLSGHSVYNADFHQILRRINAQHYVNDLGVREFWLWSGGVTPDYVSYDPQMHTLEKLRENPESNMSSPVTGDLSNSVRDPNDLPIYDHTYLVYSPTFRRSEAEAVHTRGHQYETLLSYANQQQDGNTALWWHTFVGRDANFQFVGGRCGDTHHPPNAQRDYDYQNRQPILSDCEDWTPTGSGQKKSVNATTWGNLSYAWPQHPPAQQIESQWYIYWMQNMPGRGNSIPYGTQRMTNWWTFIADWDASQIAEFGLYGPDCTMTVSPAALSIPGNGGAGSIAVSSGAVCRWIAHSNTDWLRIELADRGGQGPAMVRVTSAPNLATTSRTGMLIVAGQQVMVTQAGRTEPTPPVITTHPASQTIAFGHAATLEVVASGTAPLSYQWYYGVSGDTNQPIPGATTHRVITPALTRTIRFWVRVGNAVGQVDSTAATITVDRAMLYLPLVRN